MPDDASHSHEPGHDPIDSDDVDRLRHEILRLRDQAITTGPRLELLADRIAELEAETERLHAELAKPVVVRLARRMAALLRRR